MEIPPSLESELHLVAGVTDIFKELPQLFPQHMGSQGHWPLAFLQRGP